MDWDKEIKDLKFRLALLGVAVLLLYVVFFGLLAELLASTVFQQSSFNKINDFAVSGQLQL